MDLSLKTCTKCKLPLPPSNFYNQKGCKDNLRSRCKVCQGKYTRNKESLYRSKGLCVRDGKNPIAPTSKSFCRECLDKAATAIKKRQATRKQEGKCFDCDNPKVTAQFCEEHRKLRSNRFYKYKYGITVEEKREMYYQQNGKCEICKKEILTSRDCNLDHDHETNQIRGLLCGDCNRGLGAFKDNVEILLNTIKYLQKYKSSTNF
jgi:Recombination endonuclease VII